MTLGRLFCLATIVATTTIAVGCKELKCALYDPCKPPEGALDGRWRLEKVNDGEIDVLVPGFPIPDNPDYIKSGYMEFYTQEWDENKHTGLIYATYTIVNRSGATRPESKYTGSFEYYKGEGIVLLRAADSTRKASVIGDFTIKAYGTLPKMGRSTATFVKLKK
jgi:hypothetical protein